MRRVMFTVAATVLMAGAVPAGALAHSHHHHHQKHHARVRHFGNDTTTPTSTSMSDNAGTVQSFQNGVLTIALNDGSTVSGAVTNDTALECTSTQSSQSSQTIHDDGDPGSGDQSSGENNQGSGGGDQGDNDQNDTQGDNDQGDDNNDGGASCSTSSLTPGAVVHEASLRIGGSGAVWQKVELVS